MESKPKNIEKSIFICADKNKRKAKEKLATETICELDRTQQEKRGKNQFLTRGKKK